MLSPMVSELLENFKKVISNDPDAILQYIRDWLVYKLYKLYAMPVVGQYLSMIPLWVFGAILLAACLTAIYITYKTLSFAKTRVTDLIMDSKIGDYIRKSRTVSQAKRHARRKEYVEASELYLELKDSESAAKVLEEGEEYSSAASIYVKMGRLEKATEMYEKGGDLQRLADVLRDKGNHAKAGDVLLKMGKKLVAAESYAKAGNFGKAAGLFKENGSIMSAAECYESAGDLHNAAALFEQAYIDGTSSREIPAPEIAAKLREMSIKAGTYFEQEGAFGKAAVAFSRCGEYTKAAEASMKGNDTAMAAEYFTRGNMHEKAAEIYRESGNEVKAYEVMAARYIGQGKDVEAADMFMKAGSFVKAADHFEMAGEFSMAGEAYLNIHDYDSAAEMFVRGDDKAKAAEALLKIGETGKAARLYMELGDTAKASPLVEESGDFMLAAELYRKLGQSDREISALQKITTDDHRYNAAVIRLAELFSEQGNSKLAAEKYTQAIGGAEPDHGNIDLFYGLAGMYEAEGRYTEAGRIYQALQLVDFHYKDVSERINACQESQDRPASVPAPAPAPAAVPPVPQEPVQSAPPAAPVQTAPQEDPAKRYKVIKEIGRGGSGVVYVATDNSLNRHIALKLLPKGLGDDAELVRRLSEEARQVSRVAHANIVALYDFQQTGGRSFITMEYVDGSTLKTILKTSGKVPVLSAMKIVYQCCQGLDHVHKKGMAHLDIRPDNIMLNKQNTAKIMNLGVAKALAEKAMTGAGLTNGAARYKSPEQITGQGVDTRSDIYSLGIVFYELLTGVHPFADGDPAYDHVNTMPRPPRELRPEIPAKLDELVMSCIQKDRAVRVESAVKLALAMREVPVNKPAS